MKQNTILLLALVGFGIWYLTKGRTAQAKQVATPTPTDGITVGKVAGGWLDSILGGVLNKKAANVVAANPVQGYVSAQNPTLASTGAVYSQNQLAGVASLVSAGSQALGSLVNVAQNIFGKTTTKPASTPAASESLPSVQVAGGIPGSALSGAIEWPEASDWANYA